MNATNLIRLARAKKRDSVLTYLGLAFKDFAYPVYLFGSYATGEFHGNSDVDIVIIAPDDVLAKKIYLQACDKMAELGMNYDILISLSINRLDSSIVTSLQAISATAPCVALPPASMQSNVPVQPHPTSASPFRHQLGMTLIELLIALLITTFLLGGVLEIFTGSKQTYRMQENLSRMQENGRFAMDFLAHDIRMAGYWGCLSPNSPNTDIAGADNNIAVPNIDNNTDSITLMGLFVLTPAVPCGNVAAASLPTSCVAPSPPSPVNCYTDLRSTITYTINNAALYRNTAPNGNQSLVEGIQDMQILYGVDTDPTPDGTPNYYVSAASVAAADWAKVVSIRISLLAFTLDDFLTAQPMPYNYNGVQNIPSPDRRIRRVFNTTIALRNRLPL